VTWEVVDIGWLEPSSQLSPSDPAARGAADRGVAPVPYAGPGITIERILTDNANGYRSTAWARRGAQLGIRHTRTRPYPPATNAKAERVNRTRADDWADARLWTSDASRARALDPWPQPLQQSPPPHRHRRTTTNLPGHNN
jgi:transposase InsO family protein